MSRLSFRKGEVALSKRLRKRAAATAPCKHLSKKHSQLKASTMTKQQSRILEHLLAGIPFTKREMALEENIWCLAARISELKALGYDIRTVKNHPNYNDGRSSKFGIYILYSEDM